MRVADHERDRHRLTERAPEPEHDAADDADPRVRQHDVPDDLPGRSAETIARLLEHVGDGLEDIAHHGGDEGQHHDRQYEARGQHADPEWRPAEHEADAWQLPDVRDEPGLYVPLQNGREHEQSPDAEDDARYRGQ